MRDLFDFLDDDAQIRTDFQHRGIDKDGNVFDDRGYCPGACNCIHCAAIRVRIKRANRVRDALTRAFISRETAWRT